MSGKKDDLITRLSQATQDRNGSEVDKQEGVEVEMEGGSWEVERGNDSGDGDVVAEVVEREMERGVGVMGTVGRWGFVAQRERKEKVKSVSPPQFRLVKNRPNLCCKSATKTDNKL